MAEPSARCPAGKECLRRYRELASSHRLSPVDGLGKKGRLQRPSPSRHLCCAPNDGTVPPAAWPDSPVCRLSIPCHCGYNDSASIPLHCEVVKLTRPDETGRAQETATRPGCCPAWWPSATCQSGKVASAARTSSLRFGAGFGIKGHVHFNPRCPGAVFARR